MRCEDCADGQDEPAASCDGRVAEEAGYVRGLREAPEEVFDPADRVLTELGGPITTVLGDELPETLHEAIIAALVNADCGRRPYGGVIKRLIDESGTSDLRVLQSCYLR